MRAHYEVLQGERASLLTSDAVIAETATRLRYDAGLHAALEFQRILEAAVVAGRLSIRDSDARLRSDAFAIMARYADVALSYADCIGAAIARDSGSDAIFGLDNDFRIMGFTVEPEL